MIKPVNIRINHMHFGMILCFYLVCEIPLDVLKCNIMSFSIKKILFHGISEFRFMIDALIIYHNPTNNGKRYK